MSDTSAPATSVETLLFEDFTAGLWEPGLDLAVPPNALRQADDCIPQVQGGLRAGIRWTDHAFTGFPAAIEHVTGFHVSPKIVSSARAIFMAVGDDPLGTGTDIRILQADPDLVPLAWTTVATFAANVATAYNPIPFVSHATTANGEQDYFSLRDGAGVALGTYRIARVDAFSSTATKIDPNAGIAMVSNQDRLIMSSPITGEVKFTAPGLDNPIDKSLFIGRHIPNAITYLEASFPGDLVVLKTRGVYLVQGAINDPIVRELFLQPVPATFVWGADGPSGGVIFPTLDVGVWMLDGGGGLHELSPQIVGSPQTASFFSGPGITFRGKLLWFNNFLFTPKGYVYDFRTEAWHKTTLPGANSYPFWGFHLADGAVWAVGKIGTTAKVISADVNLASMTRAITYTAKLPPIISAGRRTEIEEVEFHVRSFNAAARIVMNLTGQSSPPAYTRDAIGSGIQVVRVPVHRTSDWWDLAFIISSQAATIEAPFLQRILVRTQDRTLHEVRLA